MTVYTGAMEVNMCDPIFGCEPLPQVALVDWDSTLNNFDEHMLRSINAKFGTSIRPCDLTSWDSLRAGANALTEDQEQFAWGPDVFGSASWNDQLSPHPGALSSIWRMLDVGMQVHVVTSRPANHRPFLRDWLAKYGLYRAVTWRCVEGSKLEYARSVGAGVAFDDSPRQICDLVQQCPVYVIERPYNRSNNLCPGPFSGGVYSLIDSPSLFLAVDDLMRKTGHGYADQASQSQAVHSVGAMAASR